MINHVDILDPIKVEVTDAGLKTNNFKTIFLIEGVSSLELFIGDKNYKELTFNLAVELSLEDTIELVSLLGNKLGGLYDYENPEYKMADIVYSRNEEKVYTKWEEKQ